MRPLAEVLRGGLERLVARRPDALEASAALRGVFAAPRVGKSGASRRVTRRMCSGCGSVLVDLTSRSRRGMSRPVAMHALANGLDALLALDAADAAGAPAAAARWTRGRIPSRGRRRRRRRRERGRHERACAALGEFLLPHVKPIAARYLRRTAPPLRAAAAEGVRAGHREEREGRKDDEEEDDIFGDAERTTTRHLNASRTRRARPARRARACVCSRRSTTTAPRGRRRRTHCPCIRRRRQRAASRPFVAHAFVEHGSVAPAAAPRARGGAVDGRDGAQRVMRSRAGLARLREDQAPDADTRHAFP